MYHIIMKLVIKDENKCNVFKTLFTLLPTIADEVDIHVNNEEVFIQAMDMGHVCLYELRLKKEWFDSYDEVESSEVYGIKLSLISKIMTCFKNHFEIHIYDGKKDVMCFDFISEKMSKSFEVSLMDLEIDMLSVPNVDHDVDMEISSSMILSLVNELNNFGEVVNINAKEETFNLESKCNKLESNMKVKIDIDDFTSYSIIEDGVVDGDFSLSHFQKIVSFSKLTDITNIYFSNDLPIQIGFNFDENSGVNFWLSPRVEDD